MLFFYSFYKLFRGYCPGPKSLGTCPGRNFMGGSCPRVVAQGELFRGSCLGKYCPRGNFVGSNCPKDSCPGVNFSRIIAWVAKLRRVMVLGII